MACVLYTLRNPVKDSCWLSKLVAQSKGENTYKRATGMFSTESYEKLGLKGDHLCQSPAQIRTNFSLSKLFSSHLGINRNDQVLIQ